MSPSTLDKQKAICYIESHEADGALRITEVTPDGVVVDGASYELAIILDVYCRTMFRTGVEVMASV